MASPKYSRYYTYIKPVMVNKFVKSSTPHVFSMMAITIFAVFAIRPTILTILTLEKNITESRTTLEALDAKAQSLTLGKQNLEAISYSSRAKIAVALPDQPAVTALVGNLQAAGSGATASALQIQPLNIYDSALEEATPSALSEVAFSFNLQGSYLQIINILSNLKQSPRLLNITNLTINRQGDGTLSLSLIGKGYFLK